MIQLDLQSINEKNNPNNLSEVLKCLADSPPDPAPLPIAPLEPPNNIQKDKLSPRKQPEPPKQIQSHTKSTTPSPTPKTNKK